MKNIFKKPISILFWLGVVISEVQAQQPSLKDTLTLSEVTVSPYRRQIIGYYPNWRMYNRKGITRHDNLMYSKYTILNYSFFKPAANGEILNSDAHSDNILLVESPTVVDLAHLWGCKVMVSIGGWTFSDQFPGIAADPVKRKKFADECVRLIKQYKFDGIDIDWEFPGYADHNGGPADKENFTLLMQDIRTAIDAHGKTINYRYLLTAAFATYDDANNMIEWDKIIKILDYCNMMTYDFSGPWTADANHNSPLYLPASGNPAGLDWVFKRMTGKYNVPAEKLNLGVAFYGRSFLFPNKDAKIYGPNSKLTDTITWREFEGTPQYYSILDDMDKFDKFWDESAQVPYLIKKDKTSFVSYDDEKSIRLKAEYMKDKNVAGTIIWEISGDYIETSPGSGIAKNTPLADVINEVFEMPKRRRKIKPGTRTLE
jgi:chitinase